MNLDKILDWFNNIAAYALANENYVRLAIPILIAIGMILIVLPLTMHSTVKIGKKIKQSKKDFFTNKGKRYVQDYINCNASRWLDKTYKYSRVYATKFGKVFNTSISYFAFSIICSAILMLGIAFLTGSTLYGLLGFVAGFAISYTALYTIRLSQKASVSRELMNFLNLLGNYSTTNTEIFNIFSQIAPQVENPLSDCLLESVAESQNPNRDKGDAIQNLANKIEDKKFKEIIKNLEMAQQNSGSYHLVVNANRRSLMEYLRGKKLKSGIARENLISFFAILAIMVGILFFLGQALSINVAQQLTGTPVGLIALTGALVITVYFVISAIAAGK